MRGKEEDEMTNRIEVAQAPAPLEAYAKHFDPLFGKSNQREGYRHYLAGLLLPSERNKTLTGLVNTEPLVGAQFPRAQKLQWFLSESNWDERQVQAQRLKLLRENPTTAPTGQGALVIDETGDRKDGHKTAHVARQYLGNVGKIENGVVSVSSLWADEEVYYPLEVEPYTPESYFAQGKKNPAFRTKPKIALQLVQHAVEQKWPFRAVVADSLYGEDRGLRAGLRQLQVRYVLALNPAHAWWHPEGVAGSLREVAHEAGWVSAEQPGRWMPITRTFRDGNTQDWWAVEIVAGPYAPGKTERAVVATTDPATLPELTTWYLVTNLPAPTDGVGNASPFSPADLQEIIRLYGLRTWVEQSYKHVKHALGWSQYQVRSDKAMRRHWQLVCCAFSFCWYYVSHPLAVSTQASPTLPESQALSDAGIAPESTSMGEKNPHRNKQAPSRLLAKGAEDGSRMAGAVDHAAALLASVVRAAPTRTAPTFA
jgi:SRSO17 transposase